MSLGRVARVTVAAALSLVGVAGPVQAQSSDPPIDVGAQVGPLALSPVIRLTNGYDSNVYNRDDNVKSDFSAILSPAVEAWLRLPRARVIGRSQFDFYYFKELTDLRALDTDTAARFELRLNRLTPYVEGTFVNTRHSQNLEIDAIARRRTAGATAGADVRLTAKISAGAVCSAGASRVRTQSSVSRQLPRATAQSQVGRRRHEGPIRVDTAHDFRRGDAAVSGSF